MSPNPLSELVVPLFALLGPSCLLWMPFQGPLVEFACYGKLSVLVWASAPFIVDSRRV